MSPRFRRTAGKFFSNRQAFSSCSPRRLFISDASPNGRGRSSGVEHYLAKVRVVSSNLIARSNRVFHSFSYSYRIPYFTGVFMLSSQHT